MSDLRNHQVPEETFSDEIRLGKRKRCGHVAECDCDPWEALRNVSQPSPSGDAEPWELARVFHETYERLAPQFSYRTRIESATPWEKVPTNNKQLMIATCAEVLQWLRSHDAKVGPAEQRLTFDAFQRLNFARASEAFPPQCLRTDFLALAIAGEAGELCNLIKKALRGDFEIVDRRKDILDEIADVMTYCDLFMSVMAANTGEQVELKWDEVSARRGWKKLRAALQESPK